MEAEREVEAGGEADGGPGLARHWTLDPSIVFLNHGSFGACPSAVLDAQARLRAQMEREPARFFLRELPPLLAAARADLAAFVGTTAEGLAFVPNVTTALNAVLRSVPLPAGSELLVTDHEYNASRNVLEHAAAECGARVVVARVPFPLTGPGDVTASLLGAVTPRTRLALLDHVTSQTAVVMPIAELIRELEARGIDVLVDGAHAPGMLPLDIATLAPAYYTGNCHKWLCAPKGAGFLWVRDDRREPVRPAVISHGANARVPVSERFRTEFDWMGTDDPTPALCVPEAIRCVGSLLPGGWDAVRAHNHALAVEGRRLVADALGIALPCPDSMLGSMAALPLPASPRFPEQEINSALDLDPLQEALFRDHGIEIPVVGCPAHPGRMIRLSAQLYNRRAHYERLAAALVALL